MNLGRSPGPGLHLLIYFEVVLDAPGDRHDVPHLSHVVEPNGLILHVVARAFCGAGFPAMGRSLEPASGT